MTSFDFERAMTMWQLHSIITSTKKVIEAGRYKTCYQIRLRPEHGHSVLIQYDKFTDGSWPEYVVKNVYVFHHGVTRILAADAEEYLQNI